MFKKIFITLFVLIILALGGASYYVSTIDWNNYKNKITAQLEDVTGKKIVINGKIDLTFFPKPHLSATNIKIYNSNCQYPPWRNQRNGGGFKFDAVAQEAICY